MRYYSGIVLSLLLMLYYEQDELAEFIEKLHLTTSLLVNAEKSEVDYYWTLMVIVFQQERALEDLIILPDQIRYQDEGDVFMARMNNGLKLIYGELTDYKQMAGIDTRNIAENRAFQDLVQQVGSIREMIVTPD
jgi:hypothetical protein